MIPALVCAVLFVQPAQTVDGVKPLFDPTPKFAQAMAKRMADTPTLLAEPDWFATGFFSMKVKTMIPLTQTKYTAAQIGICGTMLGVYDPQVGMEIKRATDRIVKGSKDFDTFTEVEREAINGAFAGKSSPIYPFEPSRMEKTMGTYMPGAHLGTLCGYVTLWHLSPKLATLQKLIGEAVDGCVEAGGKTEPGISQEVKDHLKAFAKFQGKQLDAATMGAIAGHLESTLKSSLPPKYRW